MVISEDYVSEYPFVGQGRRSKWNTPVAAERKLVDYVELEVHVSTCDWALC